MGVVGGVSVERLCVRDKWAGPGDIVDGVEGVERPLLWELIITGIVFMFSSLPVFKIK